MRIRADRAGMERGTLRLLRIVASCLHVLDQCLQEDENWRNERLDGKPFDLAEPEGFKDGRVVDHYRFGASTILFHSTSTTLSQSNHLSDN